MKHLPIALALIGVVALAGCDRREAANETPDSQMAATPDAAAPVATPDTSMAPAEPMPAASMDGAGDGVALGLLAAVDEHEIAAARQAEGKQVTGAVLDYAKMMEKEHGDNLTATQALGALADTPDITTMKDKAAKDLEALGESSGKAYETAYIDAMIAGHKDALALIDGKMMASASTDPVKQHLTQTRAHVAAHLAKAEEIKGKM